MHLRIHWSKCNFATKEIVFQHMEKNLNCESDETFEQVAQGTCDISLPKDFQNLTGQSPEQISLTLILLQAGDWTRQLPPFSSHQGLNETKSFYDFITSAPGYI